MDKNERISILFSGLSIVGTFLLYSTTGFFCGENCYTFFSGGRLDSVYAGTLGIVPTLLLLLLFPRGIFILWLKHIAWWFAILTAWTVSNFGGGHFLNPSHEGVAFFCMVILFTVTLIYALVMKKKVTNNS